MEKVTISGFRLAQNQEGEQFVVLNLIGGVELIQSSSTGKFYATARKASIPSTFTPEVAKTLLGTQVPGKIIRVECKPYSYTVPETGEEVTLNHHWEYVTANYSTASIIEAVEDMDVSVIA